MAQKPMLRVEVFARSVARESTRKRGYTRAHHRYFMSSVQNCHTEFLKFLRNSPLFFSRVLPASRLLLRAGLCTCRRASASVPFGFVLVRVRSRCLWRHVRSPRDALRPRARRDRRCVNQNAGAGNNWAEGHSSQVHKGFVRILLNPPAV
jgi:hypothetical protein